MESLIHADIFFFISTIALVVLTIGILVVIIYLIRILHNVKDVSEKVKNEGDEIVRDIKELRALLRSEGFKWRIVMELVRGFISTPLRKRKASKHKGAGEEEN